MMSDLEKSILKNVSRETLENLEKYQSLLFEWQKRFNLVSNGSLVDAWTRHFLDSAQLSEYINENAGVVCDFGSGAGFPGLVLAVLFKDVNPKTKFVLIESIAKKTLFLNTVVSTLNLNADVIRDRIEKVRLKNIDYITARAVTSLVDLLRYAEPFCSKETKCLFLKGKTYKEELLLSQKRYEFDCRIYKNKISEDGVVLEIKNIRRKNDKNNFCC